MKIKIVATTRRKFNLVSWLIKTIQGTEYSHFGIIIKSFVLEATAHGTSLVTLEDFQARNKIIKSWDLEIPSTPEALYEWMALVLGTKYGYVQNIGFLLVAMKIVKENPWGRNTKRIVCSEVVALFVAKFYSIPIGDSDQYDLVNTEKLLEKLC